MRLALLGAVLLLAAGLRFAALDFGAGDFEARPDENGVVLTLAAMERAEFFPTLVAYGGGYFHPLALFVRGWGAVFWGEGVVARLGAGDLERVRVAARTWSALLAFATVALVYVVGRRLRGERVGVLAAALLAVAPLAVREAHFAKADTAAAAAAALVMAALVLPRGGGRRGAVLVGVATALALSTKMLISVVPVAALVLAWPTGVPGRRIDWRALGWGACACAVGLVVLNTFVWRHPSLSALSARHVLNAVRSAAWLPGAELVAGPLGYHATISLRWGCGLAVALLALPAIVYGWQQGGGFRLLALLVLGHWAMLLGSPMVLARFFLPALPALAVLVAAMLVAAVDRAVARAPRRAAALALVAAIVIIEPLAASVTMVRLLGRADTRALAGAWIDTHLAPDARVVSWGAPPGAADYGRPPLRGRSVETRLAPERWDAAGATIVVWHHYPLPYSSDALPRDGAGLRRLATFDPFAPGADTGAAVVEPLDAFYLPLGRFAGVERPGPRIDVLAIEPGAVR